VNSSTLHTLRRLIAFLRPFAAQVALSILLGVGTVASAISLLGTSAYLIAYAALHPSVAVLQVSIVGVRFFGIGRAVFRYLERLVSHSVNFRLLAGLRVWFYAHLEPLAPARLQEVRSADLLNRAVADIEMLENFYVRAVAPPLVALLVTFGVGVFVARYDARLGWFLSGALLVTGIFLPLLVRVLARTPGKQVIERRSLLSGSLLDVVQGMPDLLAYGQAEAQLERVAEASRYLSRAQDRQARAGALGNALLQGLTGLALWVMLLLAIPLVNQQIDGISLAVLALITLASFEAVSPLIPAAQHFESCLQAARRLFGLVETAPDVTVPPDPLSLPTERPHLRIHGLSFQYSGDRQIALNGLDLDLPPGKRVALVGPSGAGKSTLISLLLRFWEFDSGSMEWNGVDVHRFDPAQVRQQMAVISQATYLFAGTLRQNLLLARPDAAEADLKRVLDQAQLSELVAQLPAGLDTWIGERGLQLSGGERQRVAVARALLRDAPLLLLDEPTASLDAAAELRLVETLHQVFAGRSVVYITHRLLGLEDMDEILVMQEGRVMERGSHADLLASGGSYAKMWSIHRQSLQ